MDTGAGSIHSINISGGGVPKLAVAEAQVGELGIDGDGHNDRASHGGPARALCLYSVERLALLQAEGHPIFPGSIGENITLAGIDSGSLAPGDRLALGPEVVVEVTQYTSPCKTIAGCFRDGQFARVLQDLHPGFSRLYARVITGGTIRQGDGVSLR